MVKKQARNDAVEVSVGIWQAEGQAKIEADRDVCFLGLPSGDRQDVRIPVDARKHSHVDGAA